MNNKFLKMALAGLVLSVIGFANATLIGDNVDCNISAGGSFTCSLSTNTLVEPGIEFYVGGRTLSSCGTKREKAARSTLVRLRCQS